VRLAAALVLVTIASLLMAQGGAAASRVAVVGPVEKVRPAAPVRGTAGAHLTAARNEFESFQVAVGGPAGDVRVELAAPPRNSRFTFPRKNVLVYREDYYPVRRPTPAKNHSLGRWPDALVPSVDTLYGEPRRAFPVTVPKGENRVAWVDVLVPPRAPPGTYQGALVVRADGVPRTVPIAIDVLPLRLPSTASLDSDFAFWNKRATCRPLFGAGCETEWEPYFQQAELFTRLALDDRVTLTGQQISTDRGLARKYLLPYLKGRGRTRLRGARLTTYGAGTGSVPEWRKMAEDWGYVGRSFIQLCDEPQRDPAIWRQCRDTAEELTPQWPAAHTAITTSYADARAMGGLSLFDTMVTIVEQLGAPPRTASGQRLWLYTSCISWACGDDDRSYRGHAGYAIDEPASEARATGWLAFEYGATGELLWRVESQTATAWRDQYSQGGNGDGTLFYIGTTKRIGGSHPIPIESLRLKLIRDGYEDYEYLRYLARHGRREAARKIALDLFPSPERTARSGERVMSARARLAELIRAAVR
jgi:hypothetical protein